MLRARAAGATRCAGSRSTSARRSSSARSCSSGMKLPVREEDADRPAVHRRGRAAELARGLSAAEAAARAPRAVASSSRPTPTSCRGWSTRHTGRVHTTYAQATAVTGRLSSTDPNLQNIPVRTAEGPAHPRGVHRAAGPTHRLGRLFADRAADHGAPVRRREPACDAFREGEDIHRATAAEIFGVPPTDGRPRAAPLRQGDQLRPDLRHERLRPGAATSASSARAAQQLHRQLFRALSRASQRYMERTRELARAQGYVETVFGRRLWLPDIKRGEPARAAQAPSARRSTRRCRAPPPT